MRRTEQVQGLRLMKFEEVYGRTHRGGLSQAEAAEVLGVSERTFRRWRDRYEAEGADGLYDRRLGRLAARRAPVDEVARVLELFDTRYWDFTAKHFHEKLVADHGFKRSYNWLRLSLQAHGRRRAAPRRGAHRRKRPRRALPGMMLHQDGSSHEWVPGRWWDLIVTMDDATSDIYSAFFVAEEGTMSSFQGVSEAIRAKGLFCSLYADRASHYWNTPEAGGKVDKDTPTQVGRALAQLGIELIPAYSPEARGRSERMFGTLQKRLPQELRLAGITDMVEANRFLKEVFLPQHNARFATPAEDGNVTLDIPNSILDIRARRYSLMAHSVLSAQHFHSEDMAFAYVEKVLWPDGPYCPFCGGTGDHVRKLNGKTTRKGLHKCYDCRKPFTVRIGTIFESSHLPLHLWLQVIHLMCASKKGISTPADSADAPMQHEDRVVPDPSHSRGHEGRFAWAIGR